jgi:hypothetical protein
LGGKLPKKAKNRLQTVILQSYNRPDLFNTVKYEYAETSLVPFACCNCFLVCAMREKVRGKVLESVRTRCMVHAAE